MSDDLIERLQRCAKSFADGIEYPIELTLQWEAATAIASLREERDNFKADSLRLHNEKMDYFEQTLALRERVRLRNDELEAINASHKELAHRLAESGERVRVLEGALRGIIERDDRADADTAIETLDWIGQRAAEALNEQFTEAAKGPIALDKAGNL